MTKEVNFRFAEEDAKFKFVVWGSTNIGNPLQLKLQTGQFIFQIWIGLKWHHQSYQMSGLFHNLEAGTTTAEALEKWLEKGLFILLSGPVLCYNSSRLHWQSEDRRRLWFTFGFFQGHSGVIWKPSSLCLFHSLISKGMTDLKHIQIEQMIAFVIFEKSKAKEVFCFLLSIHKNLQLWR